MFKFNRNEELQQTVNKQKDQLQKYESKIRDLVQAYKSLQNEKTALERSMKALTTTATKPNSKKEEGGQDEKEDGDQPTTSQSAEEPAAAAEGGKVDVQQVDTNEDAEDHLRSQLITLTKSLSTVSEEKNKLAAAYQNEKKKTKQDHESQRNLWKTEKSSLQNKLHYVEEQLAQTKEKCREEQLQYEQEQNSNSIMIREIQKMLNDERSKTVSLQSQIKEFKGRKKKMEKQLHTFDDDRKEMDSLRKRVDDLQRKLEEKEKQANIPSPQIAILKKEIARLKEANRNELDRERTLVVDVRRRNEERLRLEEERIGDLEGKIVMLSDKLGICEQLRHQDQLTIQKLHDQKSQLESENSFLITQQQSTTSGATHHDNKMTSSSDEQTNHQSANGEDDYKEAYLCVQQQVIELKEEVEKQKTRNLLNSIRGGRDSEKEEMKMKINDSHMMINNLREKYNDLQIKLNISGEKHRAHMEEQAQQFDKKLTQVKEENKERMHEMEREVKSQRDRTVAILIDKDKEIKILQNRLRINTGNEMETSSTNQEFSGFSRLRSSGSVDLNTEDTLNNMLQKTSEVKLLHNAEQIARRDITINTIRREKKQLEIQLRKKQETFLTKEEEHKTEMEEIKRKLEEQERSKSREGANVEYLKNVMYRFLTSKDSQARHRMTVAIATILQFSPSEKSKIGVKE